jgi:hypothetical protein
VSDLTDLFPDGTFTPEPEQADEVEEAPVDEVAEEPVDSGADEAGEEAEEAVEAPLIFGKYKSVEDAEKAYKELERQFHAQQQQPEEEEAEEEEDDDPFGLWGTALGNDEAQQLAQRMIDRPQEAQAIFEYVQANQGQFGQAGAEITSQMFALWNAQDPFSAQSWIADQRLAAYQEQIQQQQSPIQAHYTQQMASMAVHRATAELPRFAEFKDQIMETIQSPNMQAFLAANPEYASDPQKMFEVLQGAWTNEIAKEYRQTAQHNTAAPEPAGTPAVKKPRTQQRSTAAAPTPNEVDDLFEPGTFRAS